MKLLKRGHQVVAKAVSTDGTRYSLTGVYIEETKTGLQTTATNGRILATVEDLETEFVAEDFPANVIPVTAPNGSKAAIVPADGFTCAFKALPKKTPLPILGTVAVVMGEKETTLGVTDLDSPIVKTVRNIEGKFPNYKQIIPNGKATFTCEYNPKLLMDALKMAVEFGLDGVKMEFTNNESPVKITGKRNGQKLTVVVMPLTPGSVQS